MAKRIVDEEMRFSIIINGNEAQAELYKLEKSTRDLTATNKDLRAERAKLQAAGKRDTAEYKNLTAEIKRNSLTIEDNKSKMSALQKEIGITGLTMGQLKRQANLLRLQLANVIPGSEKHTQYKNELAAIQARLGQLKTGAQATEGSLSRLANGFNKYQALAFSVVASLTGIVLSMQQMIDYNGKLADSQSDVMKTTGMTKKEVDDLTKSFGLLETRTSRIDLLGIAEQGGRIGIPKDEINDFVEVMNKASVALGDSFTGGAEEVSEKLGKLKFLFEETKNLKVEEAYNAIGSAINELGANGNATEANIADFTARLGALPEKLKPSIADALALGAAFEESGIQAEVSSRAYTIFITGAANSGEKFGKVMGITKKEVEDLINTDPLDFFLKFSKGLKGMDATDTAKTLDYLGINATGVTQALGAAANNTQRFRDLMVLSNEAMTDGGSLLREYEIKNNNLAATLDKVKKALLGAFSSDAIVDGLEDFVNFFAKFIGASEDSTGSVTRFRDSLVFLAKIVAIVTAAFMTNVGWLKLVALWEGRATQGTILYNLALKAKTIATEVAFAAQQLYAAGTMLLTGNIRGAIQAIRVLSATMKTTPWGLAIGLVTAMVTAYIAFREEAYKALTVQKALTDSLHKAQEAVAGTVSSLKALQKIAEDETASQEARLKAITEINKIVPDYNENLDLSTAALQRGKIAIDNYVKSLLDQAQAQALLDLVQEKGRELQEAKNKSNQSYVEWYESAYQTFKDIMFVGLLQNESDRIGNERKKERIKLLQQEQEAAQAALESYYAPKEGPQLPGQTKRYDSLLYGGDQTIKPEEETKAFNVPTGDKEEKAAEKAAAKKKKLIDELNKDILEANRAAQDARLAMLDDEYLKQLTKLKLANDRKIEALKLELKTEEEIAKLPTDLKEKYSKKNAAINAQIEAENLSHAFNEAAIVQKGVQQQLDELEEQYQREKQLRTNALNDQLALLGTNEKAKEKLKKKFQKDELEADAAHLKELARQMQLIFDQNNFGGFDLDLLTPQQRDEILKMLEDIKKKLAEVNAAKGELSGKDPLDLGTGGTVDLFGFTAQDWVNTFTNLETVESKINAAGQAVQGFLNAWTMYYQYVNDNENRHLREFERNQNREKQKLKNNLDSKFINQRQYDQGVAALELEMDKRKADLEYTQAKRAWKLQLTQAIAGAAMATINGFNSTPFLPVGIIMGALAATLGTIQVAMIAKNKPVRGYEEGFGYDTFPVEREQDGKIFNAKYGGKPKSGMVKDPTILVGEMPELIISNPDLKKFNPEVTASIGREIRRVRGYESGYTSPAVRNAESPSPQSDNTALLAVLAENTAVLREIKEKGLTAFLVRDMENAKKLQDDLDQLKKYKQKSQV